MSFFSDISLAISAGIKALGADLSKFATAIKPVVVADAEAVGAAALAAVVQQAPLVLSGKEKLNAAITSVQGTLTAAGKTASLTVISAAVQEAHDLLSQAVHPTT